jgi:hypothetical protein
VGREGRAACAVGVKGVHGVAGQRDERAVGFVCPCCSQDETSRKIPNAWKAHVRVVETLSQSIDILRSFQPKDEIHRRGAIHDNEIIIGGAYD